MPPHSVTARVYIYPRSSRNTQTARMCCLQKCVARPCIFSALIILKFFTIFSFGPRPKKFVILRNQGLVRRAVNYRRTRSPLALCTLCSLISQHANSAYVLFAEMCCSTLRATFKSPRIYSRANSLPVREGFCPLPCRGFPSGNGRTRSRNKLCLSAQGNLA